METLLPCPFLPQPDPVMNHRCLSESKNRAGSDYYFNALKYGHYLWQRGYAARSILAITRALYADIDETDPILDQWPLPYAALRWIIASHPSDSFPGNPRISFQHQATRLRGERQTLRRVRAWAVWALIRKSRPNLSGDSKQGIEEPDLVSIELELRSKGHSNEVLLWKHVLEKAN